MNLKRYSTWSNIVGIGGTLLILAFLIYMFVPIYASPGQIPEKSWAIGNSKQIAIGVIIYAGDYDGYAPASLNQNDFELATTPYVKNPTLFQPIPKYSGPPTFNYNLAAVKIDSQSGIPLATGNQAMPANEAVLIYALISKPGEPPVIYVTADGGAKAWPKEKPFDPAFIFAPQFERTLPKASSPNK